METNSKRTFTEYQKQQLLIEWQQSGLTKIAFCKEKQIKYYTFVSWKSILPKKKSILSENSFLPVEIKKDFDSVFAQLTLKNGTVVSLYHAVEASYLSALVK